jgi:hypothetical protein
MWTNMGKANRDCSAWCDAISCEDCEAPELRYRRVDIDSLEELPLGWHIVEEEDEEEET